MFRAAPVRAGAISVCVMLSAGAGRWVMPAYAAAFIFPSGGTDGGVITVPAGGDLQAALDSAEPGDTILLEPGATYTGNFVLPQKDGSSMITIRSAASDEGFPDARTRIGPSHAGLLPKLQSPNSMPALATAPGAHHYALRFLEFLGNPDGYYDIIALGDGSPDQNMFDAIPHDLLVDRCYIHGDPVSGQTRAIALNSASTSVINSHISDIKAPGQDSQAIGGWNGPGPFEILNNYLEAAGENIMFGGADPGIAGLVPSHITVRGNHLTKQLAWRGDPQWTVKNLIELKNAASITIDGNILEYSWLAAQAGHAVLFTPRNDGGGCSWCAVHDVQFTNNLVRHVASGINILGADDLQPSGTADTIIIQNNLFEDVSASSWGGDGRFLLIGSGARNVVVDHNTALQDGLSAVFAYDLPMTGFVFTNNIIPDFGWALAGDSTAPGISTIAAYFPGGVFLDNIFAGSDPATYPVANYYPASMSAVGFVDLAGGNYRLAGFSSFKGGGTSGTDVGCNIDALNNAAGTRY